MPVNDDAANDEPKATPANGTNWILILVLGAAGTFIGGLALDRWRIRREQMRRLASFDEDLF